MSRPHRQLLVLDEDTSAQRSMVSHLETIGFEVHAITFPSDALKWLRSNRPDVILADLQMTGVDGLSVLSMMRKAAPGIAIIVMSSRNIVEDIVGALRFGAADYLIKPVVDMTMLTHAIERALEHSELLLQNEVYRQELELANRELTEYIRVLERDQKAGRSVQRKLLPEASARFGDIGIDFSLIPSLYLSGDSIDYGLLSDRYLAFYLTDVSGHGAASAFVTVWLKQLVRRYFSERKLFSTVESFEGDAARLLRLINKEVINSGVGCHMTCFVGVLDIYSKEMRYVIGGHLPFPILVTPEGCEYLSGKGKPVGIFPDATWDVYSVKLPEVFSLVVCSDGILEVLPGNDLIAKEEYLLNVTKDNANDVESLIKAFQIDEMSSVPDDIAILKVQSEKVQ